MFEAKATAVDQDVMVPGAGLTQSLLREGLLDELEIHLIPVVLGDGRRLFGADRIELELARLVDAPGVTHLRYRCCHETAACRLIVHARTESSPARNIPRQTERRPSPCVTRRCPAGSTRDCR